MVSERRKFMRFDVSLEVAFKATGNPGESFRGTTKNFSRSGLCFESAALGLPLKAPMVLEVRLPNNDTFIPVSGHIAWKKQFEDKCMVGIEFSDINKEAKSQILDYAYELWLEKNRKIKSV